MPLSDGSREVAITISLGVASADDATDAEADDLIATLARRAQKAQLKVPKEQILEVSGSPLETSAWLDYAEAKFSDVYALA